MANSTSAARSCFVFLLEAREASAIKRLVALHDHLSEGIGVVEQVASLRVGAAKLPLRLTLNVEGADLNDPARLGGRALRGNEAFRLRRAGFGCMWYDRRSCGRRHRGGLRCGTRRRLARFIRKQPFAWRAPGIIIEVGFVEMLREGEGWRKGETWSSKVNPDGPIDAEAIKIHRIRPADLKNAPRFPTIPPKVKDFVGGSPIVAHAYRGKPTRCNPR